MKAVIEKLKIYASQVDLCKRFDYNFSVEVPIFNTTEKHKILNEKNLYEQNVQLKWILKDKYAQLTDTTALDFWIINTWGGIAGFKPSAKNIEKIKTFKNQLIKGRLSLETFSTISSLSKLASFIDPDNFVIYDSRVIYALNWLILKNENLESFKVNYFPMPSGRNKIIMDFDMNTIVNLSHIKEYEQGMPIYLSKQEAYFEFCNFIKKAATEVFGKNVKPYQLEMLLFVIADREIFNELKTTLRASIKTTIPAFESTIG